MANETVSGPASGGAKNTGGLALVENAEAIARLYRRLVLLVGVQLLLSFLRAPLMMAVPAATTPMAVVVLLVLLGTAVALALTAYALTDHMGTGAPLLWAIAMFLPLYQYHFPPGAELQGLGLVQTAWHQGRLFRADQREHRGAPAALADLAVRVKMDITINQLR